MFALLSRIGDLVTAPTANPVTSLSQTMTGTGGTSAAGGGVFAGGGGGGDAAGFATSVGHLVGGPMLLAAEYLIPAGVALAGLHKLLSHQETGAGFLVDMLIKGGGAILIIQLVKSLAGLP